VLGYALQGGITGSFDPISGVLTLTGTASIADYEAVVRSLTYTNTSDQPLELSRTITVTVDDGETHDNLATATYTIHVVAANDAPLLIDDAVLPATIQAGTNPPGRKISSLFAGLVTDPDAGDSLTGLAVVGNPSDGEQGRWQYSTDGATWVNVGAVADGATALALSATTKLRFVPASWFDGEPTPLIVRALDSSYAGAFTAANRVTVDTSTHGGTTAISDSAAEVLAAIWPNPIGGAWLSPAGNLIVEGTNGNDIVAIDRAKDVTKIVVKLNKVVLGEFAGVSGKIDVRVGVGADRVTISSKITKPSLIDGGAGNDVLVGGAGDDTIFGGTGDDKLTGRNGRNVLVGGEGKDVLTGGNGRDVLLGGAGADKLIGGKGEDLLLGGVTDFETDLTGLGLIVTEWNSAFLYAERVAHLMGGAGGANGTAFLSAATVHNDGIKDVLTGGKDLDWFVVSALDTLDLKLPELKLLV
jgi:Ca2+-binding RTX toxin-like protein